jgi:hypothetical protein
MPTGAALFVTISDDGSLVYGHTAYDRATVARLTIDLAARPWPVFVVLDATDLSFGVRSYITNVPQPVAVAILNDDGPPHGYEAEYHSVLATLRTNAFVAYDFDGDADGLGTLGVQPVRP